MDTQLMQRMKQTMSQLPPQYQSELLDFGDFLKAKLQTKQEPASSLDDALLLLRELVTTTAKGKLGSPFLDLSGFKFNRNEANER